MKSLHSSFESKVLAAFSIATLVVAMLALGTWKVAGDAFAAALRVSQTHEVVDAISKVRIATLRAETSTQGYMISGDAQRLAERDDANVARETALRRIKALTAGNARQQQRWTELHDAVVERIAISRRAQLLRAAEGLAAARAYTATAHVQETPARVYGVLGEMEQQERESLEQYIAAQMRTRAFAVAASAVAAFALAVLLMVTFTLLRKQMRATEASRRALSESEQRLAITLHSIGDAVLATDTEACITRMNPVAERLTGWPLAEAQGLPVSEVFRIVNERTRAPTPVPVAMVLATGQIQGLANHTLLIARDGAEWPIADSAAPIRDDAGRMNGVVLVFREVSEQRRAEQAIREHNELLEQRMRERTAQLHESEARLQAVFEQLVEGVVITDLNGQALYANRAAIDMLGIGYRDNYLRRMSDYADLLEHSALDGTVLPIDQRPIARILRGETLRDLELNVRIVRDGTLCVRSYGGKLVRDIEGQPWLAVVSIRDITERKRAELEISELNSSLERRVVERTQQFEAASRAKSEFLANMSHELRTPLNAIIGFSEMLKDGVVGELSAKQHIFASDIFGAGSHLLSLINDILDLSKVEAGMLQLESTAVDIAPLLKASTLVVREAAFAHRIALDTEVAAGLGIVCVDERKLKQIVYNLLSNAVKFAFDGGAVTLHARRCTRADVALGGARPMRLIALPLGEDAEFLEIMVEDSGGGIAEQDLEKLFKPFTQLQQSHDRRKRGTGLGLSLVRRFAELHGGTVGVASRLGGGSSFYVWLPCRTVVPAVCAGVTVAGAAPAPLAQDVPRSAEPIGAQLPLAGAAAIPAA